VGRRREQVAVGDSADGLERRHQAATRRHFAPEAPDFNLQIPDQIRV
jgi:hypothetical protein